MPATTSTPKTLAPVDRMELHKELDRLLDFAPEFGRISLVAKIHHSSLAGVRGSVAQTFVGESRRGRA